jgi:chromosome segregation ATPase
MRDFSPAHSPSVPPAEAPDLAPPAVTKPGLSASIASDFAALKNDVDQAKELASDYQRQLAGKSNELADFKRLFEKTQDDLIHLQASVAELRQERHRLANDAMRATAFEMRLKQMMGERDASEARLKQMAAERECLLSEVEALRKVRATECDPRVKRLMAEKESLRTELTEARRELEKLKATDEPPAEEASMFRQVLRLQRRPAS